MYESKAGVDFGDPRQMALLRIAEERYGLVLRRRGREWACLCPFHEEQTPSCFIHPEKNAFHCHGCGMKGGLLDFVAAMEGTDRAGAARLLLADVPPGERPERRLGSTAIARGRGPAGIVGLLEQRALDIAIATYHRELVGTRDEPGDPVALDYCLARGLTRQLIAEGAVGYCGGEQLVQALRSGGIEPYHAWNAGLLAYDRATMSHRERQAGRLIFPIRRETGGWGWLTGRRLGPARLVDPATGEVREPPKYLHLPGPKPLLGWRECRGHAMVLLVEGIVCFELLRTWGYPVLCALGTECSAEVGERLRSFAKVVLVCDNDEAGRAMAERLRMSVFAGRETIPFQFPFGVKDVGDLAALGHGKERFHERLIHSLRRAARDDERSTPGATCGLPVQLSGSAPAPAPG